MDIGYVYIVLGFAAYFMPTVVALCRSHRNMMSIFIVNVFLGWTLLGWVIPLAWSFSDNTASEPSPGQA